MRRKLSVIFVERLKPCPSVPRVWEVSDALPGNKLAGMVRVCTRLSPAGGILAGASE